ncbi:ATP synthase subunit s, mitochondrial-like isoform X1 [Varroa jacobsoni]|uniref:ATP synthase subunit s, mitochondrial-like isoform X1 n=1 Tax=Varroa jacobsoni TaxID=62625 RepID=UPI000BF56443|nr:ATP synthase subunit s, mitochondrial-like isoform X1 [Varroa jacobsoni]
MLMQRAGRFLNNLSPLSQKPKNNLIGKPAENARYLWSFLNRIFNKVDENRIKECGPDRAASEWLIRCGASVRWKGYDKFHNDYNTLPSGQTVIEAIDATDSCIMSLGFPYLRGLKSLQEINLSKCYYLEDNCLHLLGLYQGDQIRRLRLVSCGNVSDAGIANLTAMKALEELFMFDLPAVKNREACIKLLHEALPKCKIEFPEV